jgi:hypothetical protein
MSSLSPQLIQVTCALGVIGLLAFAITAWLRKRTLYLPARADTSQPVDQEAERKRVEKIRARQQLTVWLWFLGFAIFACLAVSLAPSIKKVSAALNPTATPTSTPTATVTFTPTVTLTPKNTLTPGGSVTPRATRTPTGQPATATPKVIYQPPAVQTVIVQVQRTVIVQVEKTVLVPVSVTQIVYVEVPVTVIVTPTHTPMITDTPAPTITLPPTDTPSITPTETPPGAP